MQHIPTPKQAWVAQKQVHLTIIAAQVHSKLHQQQHVTAFLQTQHCMTAASVNHLLTLWPVPSHVEKNNSTFLSLIDSVKTDNIQSRFQAFTCGPYLLEQLFVLVFHPSSNRVACTIGRIKVYLQRSIDILTLVPRMRAQARHSV